MVYYHFQPINDRGCWLAENSSKAQIKYIYVIFNFRAGVITKCECEHTCCHTVVEANRVSLTDEWLIKCLRVRIGGGPIRRVIVKTALKASRTALNDSRNWQCRPRVSLNHFAIWIKKTQKTALIIPPPRVDGKGCVQLSCMCEIISYVWNYHVHVERVCAKLLHPYSRRCAFRVDVDSFYRSYRAVPFGEAMWKWDVGWLSGWTYIWINMMID